MAESFDREAWLAGLKPGDLVAVRFRWGAPRVGEVVKRTPSGLIDVRWRDTSRVERYRSNGYARGHRDMYGRDMLEPYTDATASEIRRHRAVCRLCGLRSQDLDKVPTDNLVQAVALLAPPPESNDAG